MIHAHFHLLNRNVVGFAYLPKQLLHPFRQRPPSISPYDASATIPDGRPCHSHYALLVSTPSRHSTCLFVFREKWLKPCTGARFQLFLSTAPRLAKNLLKRALARLSADFTHFLKIHLIGDWAKPARMAIHGALEPIACRQLPFLG